MSSIWIWTRTYEGARRLRDALVQTELDPEPQKVSFNRWGSGEGGGRLHASCNGWTTIEYKFEPKTTDYQRQKCLMAIWDEIKGLIPQDENPEMEIHP